MSEITVYEKPACTTCRTVHKILTDRGVDFATVNYYVEPLSRDKLKGLLVKMGCSARELLRTQEGLYKELGLDQEGVEEGKILDLMVQYPDLVQRPIVEKGDRAVLARPADRIAEIL